MPFGIGPLELIVVLLIVLVIFGPKRLPGLGKQLGTGIREFKDSVSGKDDDEQAGVAALPAAESDATVTAAASADAAPAPAPAPAQEPSKPPA